MGEVRKSSPFAENVWFEWWTSNYQLVSKVYLKKHTLQARTFTLNKKDSKMVQTAVNRHN